MSATTLTAMPSAITAGDTLLLLMAGGDYPAPTWSMQFDFRMADGTGITFSSADSGVDHLFTVTATDTYGWVDGEYRGRAKVTDGTQVFTIWEGLLTVKPDLSQQAENYDTRTHAQKVLDAINATLEGKATRDALSTTIAGQTITRMSWAELNAAKSLYEHKVAYEKAQLAADNGGTTGKNILVRFGAP